MPTSLQDKLWLNAQAFIPFQTLLAQSPFGWYAMQLPQGAAMSCIVVRQVSAMNLYSTTARVNLSRYRVDLEIWAATYDQCVAIENGLACFMDQTSFTGVLGTAQGGRLLQCPNMMVDSRDDLQAQTQPPKYIRRTSAMIWNNDSI